MQNLKPVFLAILLSQPPVLLATTYYISPTGGDSNACSNAAPCATFEEAYSHMAGGDTLIAKNGEYKQQIVMREYMRPPSGDATVGYTRIVAETDGGVIVNSENQLSPMHVEFTNPPADAVRYIEVRGIVFRNTDGEVLFTDGDHLKFIRDGFESGTCDGNCWTFALGTKPEKRISDCLVEECYFWGAGRYKAGGHGMQRTIFRRTVARQDKANPVGYPMAIYQFYACDRVAGQNLIAIDSDHPELWNTTEYGGAFTIASTDGDSTNIQYVGSIALNIAMGFGELSKYLDNITYSNCVGWHLQEGVYARDSAVYDHMTFGDLYGPIIMTRTVGLDFSQGEDPVNSTDITDSILSGINGTALNVWEHEDYNVFWQNNIDRGNTPIGANSVHADPQLKYILRSSDGSNAVRKAGTGGSNRGANIIKRIGVSGTLYGETGWNTVTNEDLWPFPYEDVIGRDMRSYSYSGPDGTLSGNRGFAATGQTLTNYIWTYLGNANPYGGGGSSNKPPPPKDNSGGPKSSAPLTKDNLIVTPDNPAQFHCDGPGSVEIRTMDGEKVDRIEFSVLGIWQPEKGVASGTYLEQKTCNGKKEKFHPLVNVH